MEMSQAVMVSGNNACAASAVLRLLSAGCTLAVAGLCALVKHPGLQADRQGEAGGLNHQL